MIDKMLRRVQGWRDRAEFRVLAAALDWQNETLKRELKEIGPMSLMALAAYADEASVAIFNEIGRRATETGIGGAVITAQIPDTLEAVQGLCEGLGKKISELDPLDMVLISCPCSPSSYFESQNSVKSSGRGTNLYFCPGCGHFRLAAKDDLLEAKRRINLHLTELVSKSLTVEGDVVLATKPPSEVSHDQPKVEGGVQAEDLQVAPAADPAAPA